MGKWIIVADSVRCRIYEQATGDGGLCEKEDWVHPASRLHDRDSVSDRPGSDHGAVGQGRHPMPQKTDPKVHEMDLFAQQIGARLEHERKQGAFDRLVLVAAPDFLGRLRGALSDELHKMLVGEVHKDLTRRSPQELQEYIRQAC